MIKRMSAGHAGVDAVLHGGFIDPSTVLFAGVPGTGKTVLATQCAFANGTIDRPAVYFSSLAEPLGKILQFARGLDFFDPELIGGAVLFEDLGGVLNGGGLEGALSRVTEFVGRTECSLVVIDSFRALRVTSKSESDFHAFAHELAGRLSACATTALWLAESDEEETGRSPEAAVADAIVQLSAPHSSRLRTLRVHKLRGSAYLPGDHNYRIGPAGLEAFPRVADLGPPVRDHGSTTVINGLLENCPAGEVTLVAGPPGSGKTVIGVQFACQDDQPAVYASLAETRLQLARLADGFGWECNEVRFLCDTPGDVNIDEWSHDVADLVERSGARRLVIDGLGGFPNALLARCAHAGVSVLVTAGATEVFGATIPVGSGAADNLVLLQYTRKGASLGHALTVVKTRSRPHPPQTREFEITGDGIRIGQPIDPS